MNEEPLPARRSEPSRLLIADDHPLIRKGMRGMLANQPDLEVVGEAENGREVLELCHRLQPEVVLMDVRMPQMDGITATRALKRDFPRISVLMITAHEDTTHMLEALKAGAAGYVLKYADPQQLAEAIRRVLRGESPLNPELAEQLLVRLVNEVGDERSADLASARRPSEEHPEPPRLLESLTPQEEKVLRLLARGRTNQKIGRDLLVSVSTVKKHVQRVIVKLGVSDRTQAAVRAVELGLLLPGQGEED